MFKVTYFDFFQNIAIPWVFFTSIVGSFGRKTDKQISLYIIESLNSIKNITAFTVKGVIIQWSNPKIIFQATTFLKQNVFVENKNKFILSRF